VADLDLPYSGNVSPNSVPLGTGPLSSSERERLARGCQRAIEWHAGSVRKQSRIPYVSHLFGVSGLVLEHGGTPDQAIAGLLHDALEDTQASRAEIRDEFGPEVARIVEACTDATKEQRAADHNGDLSDSAAWARRKRHYVDQMEMADPAVALVAACDKRHNLGTIVRALRTEGPAYLERFNGDAAHQIWYYSEVTGVLAARVPVALGVELTELLADLRALLPDAAEKAEALEY
jgi:(p)ppGpp synthase/HD superfamily hydrolase